jgi:hypothetical protein
MPVKKIRKLGVQMNALDALRPIGPHHKAYRNGEDRGAIEWQDDI